MVYYLQLQDRIEEALALFSSLKSPAEGQSLKVQFDYLEAYFDFFTGERDDYRKARGIVKKYEDYPHSQWKMMFL